MLTYEALEAHHQFDHDFVTLRDRGQRVVIVKIVFVIDSEVGNERFDQAQCRTHGEALAGSIIDDKGPPLSRFAIAVVAHTIETTEE